MSAGEMPMSQSAAASASTKAATSASPTSASAASTSAAASPTAVADAPPQQQGPPAESAHATESKPNGGWPRLIATVCGLGDIPLAPGTFGALAGVLIYAAIQAQFPYDSGVMFPPRVATLATRAIWASWTVVPASLLVAIVGVWASQRVCKIFGAKDPQFVVIDETSGQMLAYTLALAPANWKYLLLGFILFRLFDIRKPFAIRNAERLPGGWGVMADDWVAGIFAAAVLWLARAAGM
jgi:phosphatidylglycerophosphatase A